MSDLSGTVLDFASTFTVTRRTNAGFDANGRSIAPATSSLSISAVVVPAVGRDILRLPEGMRTKEARSIFTPSALIEATAGNLPDRVTVGSDLFEIQTMNDWGTLGGFYHYLAVKVAR